MGSAQGAYLEGCLRGIFMGVPGGGGGGYLWGCQGIPSVPSSNLIKWTNVKIVRTIECNLHNVVFMINHGLGAAVWSHKPWARCSIGVGMVT